MENNSKHYKWLFTFLFIFFSPHGFTKLWNNQYCEFQLPHGWVCALEGSEWVCQSETADRKKEAIIILAAKVRGSKDSLDEYKIYLEKPKSYQLPGGINQTSEVRSAKIAEINSHSWVDALHLSSEVPGFYTRYLATIKEDLGVAVTFSVSKNHYEEYVGVINDLVSTLRVFRKSGALAQDNSANAGKSNNDLGSVTFAPEDDTFNIASDKKKDKSDGAGDNSSTVLFIVLGLAVAFIVFKKLKK